MTEAITIPNNWQRIKVEDISLRIHYGYTASSVKKNTGTKLLRITDIQNYKVNWEEVPFCEISTHDIEKYLLEENDIVFARTGATVGKSFLIQGKVPQSVFASYLIRVQLSRYINPKYLFYFFQSADYWRQIGMKSMGSGQPSVNATSLGKISLLLCSRNEQNQIVEIIETLFSELDQSEKALLKAKQQLKVYRQALLKNAFEGRLTKIWRDQNKPKSAEVLKNKVITRRQNLYKKELISWRYSYKTWRNENKKNKKPLKPKELVFPAEMEKTDMKGLNELPIGVIWTKVGFLASIEMGQSPTGDSYNNKGNGTQLINGPVEFGSTPFSKTLAVKWTTKPTKLCAKDDLILCVRGSTTGKMNIANDIACIGRGVCSIKSEGVLQEYINHFFNYSNKKILEMGTGSTFPSISKEQILNFIIPLFSIEEQKEIITIIESRLTIIESLEKTLKNATYNCEVFRYSILKKAFEGKLVIQDFNDEPANELLNKIKLEKINYLKAQKKVEKLKPKIRRQMETKKTVLEILKESKNSISAQELWENSVHEGDIEGFYSEIKEIYSQLSEVKGEMESLLSITK